MKAVHRELFGRLAASLAHLLRKVPKSWGGVLNEHRLTCPIPEQFEEVGHCEHQSAPEGIRVGRLARHCKQVE